jgi:H+/Cl- antiporter ClcA
MSIIQTVCATGPMKSKPCLAIFGVEYQYFLWVLLFSLIFGLVSAFIFYSNIREKKFNTRDYLEKSLVMAMIIFVLISLIIIILQRMVVY